MSSHSEEATDEETHPPGHAGSRLLGVGLEPGHSEGSGCWLGCALQAGPPSPTPWHSEVCHLLLPLRAGLCGHWARACVGSFMTLLSGLILNLREPWLLLHASHWNELRWLCLPETSVSDLYTLSGSYPIQMPEMRFAL